ncbi:hypothetical protein [Bradyrhizobium sp. CCBAU 51627]|uniref:hypothetical protein n=1 Tax=Bradyrhizobium sp. CCBAU 51627 TaxID=1325088 RepID=UPI002306BA1A|nr:hypothetical protein [Bradyrhizobium sp. CCBAU 51627]
MTTQTSVLQWRRPRAGLGPGHALAEMMQGSFPPIRSYAADGFPTIAGLRNWIASG